MVVLPKVTPIRMRVFPSGALSGTLKVPEVTVLFWLSSLIILPSTQYVAGSSHAQSDCILWRAPDLATAELGGRGTSRGYWGSRPKLALAWGAAEGAFSGPWQQRGTPDRVQYEPQTLACWARYLLIDRF